MRLTSLTVPILLTGCFGSSEPPAPPPPPEPLLDVSQQGAADRLLVFESWTFGGKESWVAHEVGFGAEPNFGSWAADKAGRGGITEAALLEQRAHPGADLRTPLGEPGLNMELAPHELAGLQKFLLGPEEGAFCKAKEEALNPDEPALSPAGAIRDFESIRITLVPVKLEVPQAPTTWTLGPCDGYNEDAIAPANLLDMEPATLVRRQELMRGRSGQP
ncbi:MAG: hypothetical protein H6739_38465 [Alphaproteobacteria bacterium]|nr:hypothetical protein [Alphaproteobacteria bacterium]